MEAPAAAAPAATAPAAAAPAAAPAATAPAAAAPAADDDETICQVCFEGWSEPGNQMLYCDRCDIAVHQGCYGIAKIPEGDWFCAPCERGTRPLDVKCVICPFYGGALKPVGDEWIHVSCVIWLPEISFSDSEMLCVENLNKFNPQRFGLRCTICDSKHGACVQCSVKDCYAAMHVICAHSQTLLRMRTSTHDDVEMKQYCRRHAPPLPLEFSLTPESERLRAFGMMRHAKDVGSSRGGAREPAAEEILQAVHRAHQQMNRSRGTHKRRRKAGAGDDAALHAAGLQADPAAPARKRALSSYTENGDDSSRAASDAGDAASALSLSQGGPLDRILGPYSDRKLDDFALMKAQSSAVAGAQGDAQGSGFWSSVEPYFVPFDRKQAARMLFGRTDPPQSAPESYLQRLERGHQAVTAFVRGAPEGNLAAERLCGATVSTVVDACDTAAADHPTAADNPQGTCALCAQTLEDGAQGSAQDNGQESPLPTSGLRLCSTCASQTVSLAMNVERRAAECVFQVASVEAATDLPAALEPEQRGALMDLLNYCLKIDRRSLVDPEARPSGAAASADSCERSSDVMAELASKSRAVVSAMRSSVVHDEPPQIASILGRFSWDGEKFAKQLNMWELTKMTSQLAKFCRSVGALPLQTAGDSGAKSSQLSLQLQSYRLLPAAEATGMTEIEQEAAALTVELAERCRENASMCFDTWNAIEGARRRVGSGPHVAALGGAQPDSVASERDLRQLQQVEARTNETYRIRMNWHQMRNSVFRGTQDTDLDKPAKREDEDDSVCCICFDAESTEVNPIVFCEGCNIAVHKFCYGLPQVPEDDWYCKKCESPMNNADIVCQFCGIRDGALKRTSDGEWAHSFCAMWHSDISLRDATTTAIIKVPKRNHAQRQSVAGGDSRAANRCTVCGEVRGPVKKCAEAGCTRQYHVMCAWYDGLLCHVYDSAKQQYELEIDVYCDEHVPETVKRDAAAQKKWRNKDRADSAAKRRRRGKKMSSEEQARQQRVRARESVPDKYPDGVCAVCFSFVPEEDNAIIQCKTCKLYCHQQCYGVAVLPSPATEWQCRVCEAGLEQVECALCPRTGGLFKPTSTGGWAHLTCALWVPESHIQDPVRMEPVVAKLSKQRMGLRCVLCGVRGGGCIQCADKCYTAFHPLCAFFANFRMDMEEVDGTIQFSAFCKKHSGAQDQQEGDPSTHPQLVELKELRKHMEHVRQLTDLVQQRERTKRDVTTSRLELMRLSFEEGVWPPASEAGRLRDASTDSESD